MPTGSRAAVSFSGLRVRDMGLDAALIDLQIARRAIPVRQDPALARAAVDGECVMRWPMRVAVDEARHPVFAHRCAYGIGIDVHDDFGLGGGRTATAEAHDRPDHAADEIRPREQAVSAR